MHSNTINFKLKLGIIEYNKRTLYSEIFTYCSVVPYRMTLVDVSIRYDTIDNMTCVQDNDTDIYMHIHIEHTIADFINTYLTNALFITGTIGNIL